MMSGADEYRHKVMDLRALCRSHFGQTRSKVIGIDRVGTSPSWRCQSRSRETRKE